MYIYIYDKILLHVRNFDTTQNFKFQQRPTHNISLLANTVHDNDRSQFVIIHRDIANITHEMGDMKSTLEWGKQTNQPLPTADRWPML